MIGDSLVVRDGYGGEHLDGSLTISGATFASLGVSPGTHVWTWARDATADSLTLIVGDAPRGVTITVTQVDGAVIVSGVGTLDLTALTPEGAGSAPGGIDGAGVLVGANQPRDGRQLRTSSRE